MDIGDPDEFTGPEDDDEEVKVEEDEPYEPPAEP